MHYAMGEQLRKHSGTNQPIKVHSPNPQRGHSWYMSDQNALTSWQDPVVEPSELQRWPSCMHKGLSKDIAKFTGSNLFSSLADLQDGTKFSVSALKREGLMREWC